MYKTCREEKTRALIHAPFNTQERRSNYLAFVSPTHKLAFDIAIIVPGYKIKQSLYKKGDVLNLLTYLIEGWTLPDAAKHMRRRAPA